MPGLQPLANLVNQTPILGPIGVGIGTLGSVWVQVLPSDAARKGITFYNPGATRAVLAAVGHQCR